MKRRSERQGEVERGGVSVLGTLAEREKVMPGGLVTAAEQGKMGRRH